MITKLPKHPGGRPRKQLSGQALTQVLTLRLTADTHSRLAAKAALSNLPLAEWARFQLNRLAR